MQALYIQPYVYMDTFKHMQNLVKVYFVEKLNIQKRNMRSPKHFPGFFR